MMAPFLTHRVANGPVLTGLFVSPCKTYYRYDWCGHRAILQSYPVEAVEPFVFLQVLQASRAVTEPLRWMFPEAQYSQNC